MFGIVPSIPLVALLLVHDAQSVPVSGTWPSSIHDFQVWLRRVSDETLHRVRVAQQHFDDKSDSGQAFRNDTMMRVNIEREAQDLPLVDLSQVFGVKLPASRDAVGVNKRSNIMDFRAGGCLGQDAVGPHEAAEKHRNAENYRPEGFLPAGNISPHRADKRSEAAEMREAVYLRSGTMYSNRPKGPSDAEEFGQEDLLQSDTSGPQRVGKRSDAEEMREAAYLRSGTMYSNKPEKRSAPEDTYSSLLDRKNLALGAIERVNIARRVLNQSEITTDQSQFAAWHSNEYVPNYWSSSIEHGRFWITDQAEGKPNFIQGGQVNGFGFTQSTFHKLHCLANIRMMLSWHINGMGTKMTREMSAHAIHCLEYIRARELANPDLNEEPIDTVDYKGMGIH